MTTSRRTFIRQVIALGPVAMTFWIEPDLLWGAECNKPDPHQDCTLPVPPTATRFIPNEPKIGIRHSAAEMSQAGMKKQLDDFRAAICQVRNLPPNDLISWTKLVAQHCIRCARTYPSNVHYDWQFPTWHRGLLYFLERQLRIMSKNDNIRLIYWDWENKNSRVMPAIYGTPNQPLYWANRYLGPLSFPLTDDLVNVQPLLALPTFEAFGGTGVQRKPVPALYTGPHANVHNAFANPTGAAPQGDMANLQYSPRDPLFYAHHSNIDRVWASWSAIPGHVNPDFKDAKVYFYDENRKWRYVLMNDLRDERKLGYQYSSLMKPAVAAPKTFAVAMAANHATLSAAAMTRMKEPTPDFVHIRDIQNLDKFPPDTRRYGIFDVKPPVGTDARKSPNFLGMVSRVLSLGEGHDHGAEVLSAALDVTGKIPAPASKGLDLFIAPLAAQQKTTAPAIPLVAEAITFIS
jgi:hypothetical protein